MEKRITKKLLAILMIITILATDFFVLGSNLITYAANKVETETKEPNVEFSAYFKNEAGEKVSTLEKGINKDSIKLYAKLYIKNEGRFNNGVIELQSNDFNLISANKGIIKDNKINLNQIDVGQESEVEIVIEPIFPNKISPDMLLKATVALNGTYVSSENAEGEIIDVKRDVSISYQVNENANPELYTEISTNKVFQTENGNKRIIQALIKSRLIDNQYPVEQTILNVGIPKFNEKSPETIKVLAANGRTIIESWTNENETLQVILKNQVDEKGKINWDKSGYDELVVTFMYPEDVDTTSVELKTNSQIKVYNSTNLYNAESTITNTNTELNNIIMANPQITTTELYKGQLYANVVATDKQNISYNTTTTIVVTNASVTNGVVIKEGLDKFVLTDNTELNANGKYISTEINKEKMLEILGTDGSVTIKNGETTTVINKDSTETLIRHENLAEEIEITTTKPIKEGILEIKHSKVIAENSYSKQQIKAIKELKTVTSVEEKITETSVDVTETITKAELTIVNEGALSTTETNHVTLGVTLNTDNVKYDLYKNPTIKIDFPSDVENVQFKEEPKIMNNPDGLKIASYDAKSNNLTIQLSGEQKAYAETSATQLYLQLDLNVTLSRLATSKIDKLTMTINNANSTEAYIEDEEIEISATPGLIKIFNLSSNKNTSISEEIKHRVAVEETGKEFDFEMTLVNNTGADAIDVKVLGKLPTTGNENNTLETTLKSVTAPNATIYFTENSNATADIEDTANGWTQDLASLTNAKLFLIKLENLAKGSNYTASFKAKVPNVISNGLESYAQYEVIFNADSQTKTETSRKIWLKVSADLEVELTANVGQQKLKNDSNVKEGEVIKYTATVTNNTEQTLDNIEFKAQVPTGTVVVEPTKGEVNEDGEYVYLANTYYEEKPDIKEIVETITLKAGETYTKQYEVRVKTDITAGTQVTNKVTATLGTITGSDEITHILEESSIRVTIKRADDIKTQLLAGSPAYYDVFVENLSSEPIKNLNMEIISNTYNVLIIDAESESYYGKASISISEIPANGVANFDIYGEIAKDIEEHKISTIITDSNGEQYRSNVVREELPKANAEIVLSSSKNNKNIQEGDVVDYNITVKNTGVCGNVIKINNNIPKHLEIQTIKINEKLYLQTTDNTDTETYTKQISNYRMDILEMEPGQTGTMYIKAKVKYIPAEDNGKTVTNEVVVSVNDIEKNTAKVTHILKANMKEEANLENIVSGYIWKDSNKNGQKDAKELALEGMNVKLYDESAKCYVLDAEGNIVEAVTDAEGKYRFTNIPDGAYRIVFEYDTETYELTTYLAKGVDTVVNSKATIGKIVVDGIETTVTLTDIVDVQENVFNINMGLIEKETIPPSQGGDSGNEDGDGNQGSEDNEEKDDPIIKKSISGYAWLDKNQNGQKDVGETTLAGIKVRIYDISTSNYLKDDNGNIIETTTDAEGKYTFNIKTGSYLVIFEYDTEEYEPTTYLADGVSSSDSSKVVLKKLNINGEEKLLAVTDTINLQSNLYNVNIGLKEKLIFDLELNKYISRIVVQTNKQTKAYDYDDSTFEKVEIHRKQIEGSLVVLEYSIKVKNNGEIAGYVRNIVDYLPNGLTFSSELNADWYLSGSYLYTKSLENVELQPGEEKEVKLILTKTMTSENTGLINNRAEIYQDYNKYGNIDIDSTPNNQAENEDDIGSTDVMILVSTGGSTAAYVILLMINMVLIGMAIKLMIRNKIIRIPTKRGRR